jgi:glycosyltransferase involved in cell wall biosynthesis
MVFFKFSIIIPCHKEKEYLIRCVDSVFNQVWMPGNYEIILVLDRPDFETERIARNIGKHERVIIVYNNLAPGPASSRNVGIVASQGDWIIFLDGDDVMTVDSIKQRSEALKMFPDANWIVGDFARIDEHDNIFLDSWYSTRDIDPKPYYSAFKSGLPVKISYPSTVIFEGGMPWTGAVMINKKAIIDVGLFDNSLLQAEDVNLWIRLMLKYPIVFIPKKLAFYRDRFSSITKTRTLPYYWSRVSYGKILNMKSLGIYRDIVFQRLVNFYIGDHWVLRENGDYYFASKLLCSAFVLNPLNIAILKNLLILSVLMFMNLLGINFSKLKL